MTITTGFLPTDGFWGQSSRRDRTVTLFDLLTRKPLCDPLPLQAEPYFLCFAPDGRTLAIGCQKGGFYLWNWRDDPRPRRIETSEKDMVLIHFFLPPMADGPWAPLTGVNRS